MTLELEPVAELEAEGSVLGAMLISPKAIEAVADTGLAADNFYRPSHGAIYTAILELYAKGTPADSITVSAHLPDLAEQVRELANIVPSAGNAKHWANVVREAWMARGLIEAGREIRRLGEDRPAPMELLMAEADRRIFSLQQNLAKRKDVVLTSKDLVAEYERKLLNPPGDEDGIASPFVQLPRLVGGRLYILAGYRKFGKTAMSLQFLQAACEAGARVGFGSAEMSHADLFERLLTTYGIPYNQVRSGQVNEFYRDKLEAALKTVSEWDFEVEDDASANADDMRRAQRRGKYDFLIFDHLHRIPVKDARHKRIEVMESVRKFAVLARDFDIPVLLLCQLTRGPKHDPFPRPTTDALSETGAIEQEAAMVMMVYRKLNEFKEPGTDAELIISANRFGPEYVIPLHFRPSQVRFVSQSPNREEWA